MEGLERFVIPAQELASFADRFEREIESSVGTFWDQAEFQAIASRGASKLLTPWPRNILEYFLSSSPWNKPTRPAVRRARGPWEDASQPSPADVIVVMRALELLPDDKTTALRDAPRGFVDTFFAPDSEPLRQFARIRELHDYAKDNGWKTIPLHLRGAGAESNDPHAILDFGDPATLSGIVGPEAKLPGATRAKVLSDPDRLFDFLERTSDVLTQRPLYEATTGVFSIAMRSLGTSALAALKALSTSSSFGNLVHCQFQAATEPTDVLYSLAAISQRKGMGVSRYKSPAKRHIPPADYCFGRQKAGAADFWDRASKTVDQLNTYHDTTLF